MTCVNKNLKNLNFNIVKERQKKKLKHVINEMSFSFNLINFKIKSEM